MNKSSKTHRFYIYELSYSERRCFSIAAMLRIFFQHRSWQNIQRTCCDVVESSLDLNSKHLDRIDEKKVDCVDAKFEKYWWNMSNVCLNIFYEKSLLIQCLWMIIVEKLIVSLMKVEIRTFWFSLNVRHHRHRLKHKNRS